MCIASRVGKRATALRLGCNDAVMFQVLTDAEQYNGYNGVEHTSHSKTRRRARVLPTYW